MTKDIEWFVNKIETVEIAEQVINSMPDDDRIKQTFQTFLNEAKKGDKEAWEILRQRLAGFMHGEQHKYMY